MIAATSAAVPAADVNDGAAGEVERAELRSQPPSPHTQCASGS